MIDLMLPSYTFLRQPVDTVGIWLSGGADSTLLCYMLAKHIIDNQLNTQIQALTVQKRPNEYYDVQQRIATLLGAEHVFKEPVVYTVDRWSNGDYHSTFHNVNMQNVIAGMFNYIYSGITQTPDKNVYDKLNWTPFPEIETIRNEDIKKLKVIAGVVEQDGETYEFGELRPLFHVDKSVVAKLYKEYDLMETLFPYTKSCENRDVLDGHCGECWFCQERLWAFGKL